ncbi:Uncharacterised protein [Metamycoplasma cloacale]|uniref:Uncharacterized protein n=1 Tax=Metamycoplasma cloacale TaxID=92401 RepID=A0A2Z4LMH1_9BACT|nr:hypothetical protein [Metamycoplasma cloacale]AWX42920.1 hypothetical protein DK849_02525 [Metamycoplasma cloacale]VEU79255.1 Uncharacterised protein [Metamycoplasma cloacale]
MNNSGKSKYKGLAIAGLILTIIIIIISLVATIYHFYQLASIESKPFEINFRYSSLTFAVIPFIFANFIIAILTVTRIKTRAIIALLILGIFFTILLVIGYSILIGSKSDHSKTNNNSNNINSNHFNNSSTREEIPSSFVDKLPE